MLVLEAVLSCPGPFPTLGLLVRGIAALCAFAPGPVQEPAPSDQPVVAQTAGFQEAAAPAAEPPAFVFEPSPGAPKLVVPRAETLVYRAHVEFGILAGEVGTVTQTCSVEAQPASVIVMDPAAPAGDAACINLHAYGKTFLYELDSTLETRVLPQEWPRLSYRQETKSSKGTRRREVLIGRDPEGSWKSSYRGDTRKGAPEGTRIWRPAEERAVPAGSLDMLTGVLLARTLIREQQEALTFPLVDKDRVWRLTLRRGEERRMEIPAGVFDVVEIVLEPTQWPGESFDEKEDEFEGVFGIHGTIHLWVERKTGIAVRIQGDVPVSDGLITLGVDVVLDSFSGTPPDFRAVDAVAEAARESEREK